MRTLKPIQNLISIFFLETLIKKIVNIVNKGNQPTEVLYLRHAEVSADELKDMRLNRSLPCAAY